MSLKMCHLLPFYADVDFKKNIRKRAQIETVVVEYFAMCSADFTCVGGPTMQEV